MYVPFKPSLPASVIALFCLHGCNEAIPIDEGVEEPPLVSEGPVYMPRPEGSDIDQSNNRTQDARTPYVPPRQDIPEPMDEEPILEDMDAEPLMFIDMGAPHDEQDPGPDPGPADEPHWEVPNDPGPLFCDYQVDVGSACRWMADCFASRGCPTAAHEAGHQSVENHCRFQFRPDEIALLCGSGLTCEEFAGVTPLCHRL